MTDVQIRAEIAIQIHDNLVLIVAAIRSETEESGGPVADKALERVAKALQTVVDRA